MGVEVNNFTCAVNSALVLDRPFEDQIKFAADMLVTEKSVGRGVRRDAVENQFLAAFAGEPRYRKTVAEIAPGKARQRGFVDAKLKDILQGTSERGHGFEVHSTSGATAKACQFAIHVFEREPRHEIPLTARSRVEMIAGIQPSTDPARKSTDGKKR